MSRIVLLPGDGIGPEVMAARELLAASASRTWRSTCGRRLHRPPRTPLTPEVLDACRAADAVLLGAVGGPKWDVHEGAPAPSRGCWACARAWTCSPTSAPCAPARRCWASPLRPERLEGTDLVVVRELTGGLYFGESGWRDGGAFDTCVYSRGGGASPAWPSAWPAAASRASTRRTCSRRRGCGARSSPG